MSTAKRMGVCGCGSKGVTPIHRNPHTRTRWPALTFILLTSAALANAVSDNAGTKNGAFLKIATDARGVALGPAIVSMAAGAEGMRWNPGALGMADSQEVSASHIQYFQGVALENVTFAYPMEQSAIAANIFYLSPGSLDGRDSLGNATGNFRFYDLVGSLGYGHRLHSRDEGGADVYLGGAIKLVQEKIAETQTQNPAIDIGILVVPDDNLRVGLSARNLSSNKANFAKEITGGASYVFLRDITAGVAARYADDAPIRYGVGAEWRFPEFEGAVVRAGYQTHDALDDSLDSGIPAFRGASVAGVTAGAGFQFAPPGMKSLRLNVDYALAPFGALGIAHTITVRVRW
jgi:hypothetical protein